MMKKEYDLDSILGFIKRDYDKELNERNRTQYPYQYSQDISARAGIHIAQVGADLISPARLSPVKAAAGPRISASL